MRLYKLTPTEEIIILLSRIEEERYKVLFVHGEPYHKKAIKKIDKYQRRIVKLGGNVDAKIKVELNKGHTTNNEPTISQ